MKIDYFKIVQDSAKFTWRYKILWIFGFLLAWLNGNGSSSSSSNYSDIRDSTRVSDSADEIANKFEEFFSSPYIWLFIILAVVLILALFIISWYIRRISEISIMKTVDLDRFGKQSYIKFCTLWKKSNSYILRFLALDLYKLYLIIPFIFLFIVSSFAISFFRWVSIIMLILTIIILMITLIVVQIYWSIAERLIVIDDISAKESLKMSWNILRKYYKEYFLAWLTSIIPGCLFSLVSFTLTIASFLPIAVIFITSLASSNFSVIGLVLAGCGCCAASIFLKALEAPFQVFKVTYWTKFLMELKEISFGGKFAEEAEVL